MVVTDPEGGYLDGENVSLRDFNGLINQSTGRNLTSMSGAGA